MDEMVSIMEKACPMGHADRLFKDLPDLIRALGCRLVPVSMKEHTITRDEQVGNPPDGDVCLLTGGRIAHRHNLSLNVLAYAAHEAIHHFHGPEGLTEELTMMALEYALYGMIRDDGHRHAAFTFFSDSYDTEDEVGAGLRELGVGYFTSERWENVLEAGQPWVTKTGRVRAKILKRLG